MNKRKAILVTALLLILACQVIPTPPALKTTSRSSPTTPAPPSPEATIAVTAAARAASLPTAETRPPSDLPPFPYQAGRPFAEIQSVEWQPGRPAQSAEVALPASVEQIANRQVLAGLTLRQQAQLAQNGFVILHSQEAQFSAVRERVALRFGQPYFLTTDAVYHALDLTLDELLAALEKEELHRRMTAVVRAMMNETLGYLPLAQGGELEQEIHLAAAYLGVGLRLLDPQAAINPILESEVNAQVAQISEAGGLQESVLIPGYRDDFRAYQPGGRYQDDPNLQAYYRGMTWFERAAFPIDARGAPGRVPLILTLALRRAPMDEAFPSGSSAAAHSAAQEWAIVRETLAFLRGAGPGYGPAEYAALMDQIYGRGVTVVGLADAGKWDQFLRFVREMPAAQLGGSSTSPLAAAQPLNDWRFMGQGFRLDHFILQSLQQEKAKSSAEGENPPPSSLDLMAALGSPAALDIRQKAFGAGDPSYPERVAHLSGLLASQRAEDWFGSTGNSWLYSFRAQVAEKDERYPAMMRSSSWAVKDLNSALGGWVSLRRETVETLPAQETSAPDSQRVSGAPPAYVEPNPEVFYRLARLATAFAEGLDQRGLTGVFSTTPNPTGLKQLTLDLLDLGDRIQRLGDLAAKELSGAALDADDWALILSPLGPAEERLAASQRASTGNPLQMPPVATIITLKDANSKDLQVALGGVDRIYVLTPVGGELLVAQGGVFSFYEFVNTLNQPLGDNEWRKMLANNQATPPEWAAALYLAEGNAVDVLAFRIGDVYRLTPAAGQLNLRVEPGRSSKAARRLNPGDIFQILAGPTRQGGSTWWYVRLLTDGAETFEGWLLEDQQWYERVWRPSASIYQEIDPC